MADSTAQAITYWDKGDKEEYAISIEKIRIKNQDTLSKSLLTYEVEVEVLDQTPADYTVSWKYKNTQSTDPNPIIKKILQANENCTIIYKIDEMGTFIELINWEQIRDHIYNSIDKIKQELPEVNLFSQMMDNLKSVYASKENIENAVINDILQFHFFHGVQYKLRHIIRKEVLLNNTLAGDPFKAEIELYMDEMDFEDENFILRYHQIVDSQQLWKATSDFLKSNFSQISDPLDALNVENLNNNVEMATRMHVSGWPIYSFRTETLNFENQIQIKETIIEIK